MERQIFINEMQARFNLRKPRSEKPANLTNFINHSLRHTFTTRMCEVGVNTKAM